MSDLTIKVRLPAREVRRRLAELPGILAGDKPDRDGLRSYFFAALAKLLFSRIHEAFRIKAAGGTDSLGNSWRALAKSTIRRRLSPSYLRQFPLSAQLQIMRLSDTLFKSLAPGQVTGDTYRPEPNQVYKLTRDGLTLGTAVEYARKQHRRRPLWPDDMRIWLEDCVNIVIGYTLERLAIHMARER